MRKAIMITIMITITIKTRSVCKASPEMTIALPRDEVHDGRGLGVNDRVARVRELSGW